MTTFKADGGWALKGIFLILLLGVLIFAKTLLIPVVIALLLALVLSPIRRALNHIGVPSGVAAAVIMVSLTILLAIIGTAASMALQQMNDIETLIPRALERLEQLTGIVDPVVQASEQIETLALSEQPAQEVVLKDESVLSLLARGTPTLFGMIVLGITLTFFLIASGDMFYEKLVQVMPKIKDKAKAIAITRSIEKHLSCYLLTITLINAGLGVAIAITMMLLGMPNPILFGLMAFLLNYIPYLGGLGGVAIAFFVGLLTFETVGAAAIPALAYWGLTSLEGQFLTPVLVGRSLKLNAVVVFLSLAIWAWLWSFVGMFLSTPILIAIKVFADRVPSMEGLGRFLAQRDNVSRKDGIILRKFLPYEEPGVDPSGAAKVEPS
jgi:predicted PurR-regulated permease PerM